jgi:hypothetical protein
LLKRRKEKERYMRYSVAEAIVIIEQLKKFSINDLDTLFNTEALQKFQDIEGEIS